MEEREWKKVREWKKEWKKVREWIDDSKRLIEKRRVRNRVTQLYLEEAVKKEK